MPNTEEYTEEYTELAELEKVARYRSLGICKALGIERERFRDWIKTGQIRPTLPAFGQGTKAGFTLGDVYTIALFKRMIETGYKRELSAKLISPFIGLGNPIEFLQYILCIVKTNPDTGEQDIQVESLGQGDRDTLQINLSGARIHFDVPIMDDIIGWEGMFMFNLVQLRQEVNAALEDV